MIETYEAADRILLLSRPLLPKSTSSLSHLMPMLCGTDSRNLQSSRQFGPTELRGQAKSRPTGCD
jgi:hypothetical protein